MIASSDDRRGRDHRAVVAGQLEDQAAEDHADQDRDRRAHLDQAVAAGQFLGLAAPTAGSNTSPARTASTARRCRTAPPAAPACSAVRKPTAASDMIAISIAVVMRISRDFSSFSANCPAVAENRK